MSCSYSTLEDAWDTPRDRYRSSRKDHHKRRDVSLSPTPSSGSEGAQTLVIGADEGYESSVPGDRDVIISRPGSRSPSVSQSVSVMDSRPFVTSGRGSPVSLLDEDDYVSDSGESVMMSRSASVSPSPAASIPEDLPGFPSGTNPPRPRPMRTPGDSGMRRQPGGNNTDKTMMRQILRIRDDVREMLQSKESSSGSNVLQSFPFMETGLFIAVGLFILLAMQMMVRLRPIVPDVTTAGSSIGNVANDMIKNIRLVE